MPEPTSEAAVVTHTILRSELAVTISDTVLDTETTALHDLLDDGRRHCDHWTTGQIVPAGRLCPS
jgi:hypothetical protein